MRLLSAILAAVCLLGLTGCTDTDDKVSKIRGHIEAVGDLEQRGVLTPESAAEQREHYLGEAQQAIGETITLDQLKVWDSYDAVFTWTNILFFVAGLFIVLAVIIFFGQHIVPLFAEMPPVIWEVLAYAASGALMFLPANIWFVFPGCLLLIGALSMTKYIHFQDDKQFGMTAISFICCLAWSAVAVMTGSAVIGFIAVLALESFLGFSVLVTPLCYCIGFNNEQTMVRATSASLPLLIGGVALTVLGAAAPTALAPFTTGLLFVGTFVYFVGLLIMGSKWVAKEGTYLWRQFVMVVSGVAAVTFGTLLGVGILQGIAGTFFALYLLEKYIEIPWKKGLYALALAGLGGFLWGVAEFAKANPEYFLIAF